jgi:WD40 repeat protein
VKSGNSRSGGDGTAGLGEKWLAPQRHEVSVASVEFSRNGRYLASTASDGYVYVFDRVIGRVHRTAYHGAGRAVAVFGATGEVIATSGVDGKVRVSRLRTGDEELRLQVSADVTALAFGHNDGLLAVADRGGTIFIYRRNPLELITSWGQQEEVLKLAFSPDSRWLVSGGTRPSVGVWNAERFSSEAVLRIEHDGFARSIAFSSDARLLASGGSDGTARIVDLTSLTISAQIAHEGSVNAVSFNPRGTVLASASNDYTVRISVARTAFELFRIEHDGQVNDVAFSRGGDVASASNDYTARLYHSGSRTQLGQIDHKSWVTCAAYSGNSKYLATGCGDGTVSIHAAGPPALVAELKSLQIQPLSDADWLRAGGRPSLLYSQL